MLQRPNICYIFEKLRVQRCQIWHSHVSIPFNSAPAHSTHPHNAKKSSLRHHFRRNSRKLGSQNILLEEILHKRIVHINGSVYVNNIYSLNVHLESVYVNNIYTLNGHLTSKSVYVNNIYTLNWHLTRKSVYAESPVHANFWCNSKFSFFPFFTTPRAKMAHDGPPLTPKKWPKMAAYEPKMAKNALWKIANQISKNNCNLFSSIFHLERPASRYGRLKLKFLCEWNSHCIYSFCSIELTKTRNARSVTAVLKHPYFSCNFVVWLF